MNSTFACSTHTAAMAHVASEMRQIERELARANADFVGAARNIDAALAENAELRAVIDEAARCFSGPNEQTPGTWGWNVAVKLFEMQKKYPITAAKPA